jgi:hypothetical protein
VEIHPPKAAHNLREFAIELVTIVAGIVIAIGLEQAVELIHWHHKVETARVSLREELQEADDFYQFRVTANECVGQRLSQLNDIAEAAARHEHSESVGDLTLHIGHLLADDAWQSERAAQSLVHFPLAERKAYSQTYGQQIDIRGWVNQELAAWAAIRLLQGDPGTLTPSDFTVIRQNIQIARTLNYLIVLNGGAQLERASKLGLPKGKVASDEARAVCAPLRRTAPTLPYTTY